MNIIKRFAAACHKRRKEKSLRAWAAHRAHMENTLDKILGLSEGKSNGQRKHH